MTSTVVRPEVASAAGSAEWLAELAAYRAWLDSHNPYDPILSPADRLVLGTAQCPRCHRSSAGVYGCTAGC